MVRVLFHYTGTPFEDVQLKREAWMEFKESGKTPFGLLPILEVDGTVLSSSEAIVCYIAEVFGLDGDTPLERARCRMVLDSLNDILNTFIRQYLEEKGDSRKAQMTTEFVDETLPYWVDKFEALLKQNDGGDGWFVGNKLTYADIAVFDFFDNFSDYIQLDVSLLMSKEQAPKLSALWQKVRDLPAIAAYVDSRPYDYDEDE